MRQIIRPFGATLLIGKNTLLKAGIRRKMQKPEKSDEDYETRSRTYRPMPELETLLELCNGNVGFIFCKDRIEEMKGKLNGLKSFKEPSVGLIAPHDIVIQPGPTSVLKNKKHFFEMLGIAYKIKWNTINIMEEKKLVSKGKKITKDQYAFMEKTNILHVVYELKFTHFYDNGAVYNPSMLDIGKSRIIQRPVSYTHLTLPTIYSV
eukprot:TRINITY_DN1148_c0_g1_i26.p1 TRINITY_DN1148_c0_g1~~TRINITY_DN1148_c0_g1_i26.p1  ORF type:complete len:206 (+),score=30.41 TRINITY_DN1148_c0_g1_i26:212-829(+)